MAQTWKRIEVTIPCPVDSSAKKIEEMLNRLAKAVDPIFDNTFKDVVILEADPTTCDNPNCGCHPHKER
jgi:hypothetical protein